MVKSLLTYLHESFSHFSNHIAIQIGTHAYRYSDLKADSKNIAHVILKENIQDSIVVVFASKRYEVYASIVGVLESNQAYCPLNPKFPEQRNFEILKLSKSSLLIGSVSDERFISFSEYLKIHQADLIISEYTVENIRYIKLNQKTDKLLKNQAYLLFTSGTTGTPKGVLISQKQVCSYLENISEIIQVSSNDRCSHTFDLTFDLSVHDLFLTWKSGATLCVPQEGDLLSPAKYIKENQISVWFSVPSVAEMMRKLRQLKENNLSGLHTILFCGEALSYMLVKEMRKASPLSRIINLYGPTEATIAISSYEIDETEKEAGIVELGTLFKGNDFRMSEAGELLLSGTQVIEDYYTKESTERFLEWGNKRWYRTGDLVELKNDILLYKGRLDEQVKYRGYRIELKEIEFVVAKTLKHQNVVCLPIKDGEIIKELVLVIEGEPINTSDLKKKLLQALPEYMVPGLISYVSNFPLNSNGKIDKKAILELIS